MKSKTLCKTARCMNTRVKGRTICNKCHSRNARDKNPVWAAWRNLASSARKRRLPFELTFEQFKDFAVQTDYVNKKGRTSTSYSVDRKDSTKGYTIDNIQCMTYGLNCAKGKKKLDYDWQTGYAQVITSFPGVQSEAGPF